VITHTSHGFGFGMKVATVELRPRDLDEMEKNLRERNIGGIESNAKE
jgi:hypothetical protein